MDYFSSFFGWLERNLDFPSLVLIAIMFLGLWVLWRTQKDPNNNFNFEDMLRDETGKPSAYRLAVFVCLAVSTWVVMYMVIATKGVIDTWIFAWYIAVWSGAKVAEKGIEAYANRNSSKPQAAPPYCQSPYQSNYPTYNSYGRPNDDLYDEGIPTREPNGLNSIPDNIRSK